MNENIVKERKIAYVEVLEILNYVEEKYVKKIPREIISFFENNKSIDYKFVYDTEKTLEEQVSSNTTLTLLAMINLNYWCEDEVHKKELIKKYSENENKYQTMLKEKYNIDNIFKSRKNKIQEDILNQNSLQLQEQAEINIFKLIQKKIKSIFRKK